MTAVVRLAEVIASGIVGLAFAPTNSLLMIAMMMMLRRNVSIFFWNILKGTFLEVLSPLKKEYFPLTYNRGDIQQL